MAFKMKRSPLCMVGDLPPQAKPSSIGEFLNPFDQQSKYKRKCKGGKCSNKVAYKANRGTSTFSRFSTSMDSKRKEAKKRGSYGTWQSGLKK